MKCLISIVLTAVISLPSLAISATHSGHNSDRFKYAKTFINGAIEKKILNEAIQTKWQTSDTFTYKYELKDNQYKFLLVNAKTAKVQKAFDHEVMAIKLSELLGKNIEPYQLPISSLVLDKDIHFKFDKSQVLCSLDLVQCKILKQTKSIIEPPSNESPDKKYQLFTLNYNLWLKDVSLDHKIQITADGSELNRYGKIADYNVLYPFLPRHDKPPVALWSPNSQYVMIHQLDERKVRTHSWTNSIENDQDGTLETISYNLRYAFATDENLAIEKLKLLNTNTLELIDIDLPGHEVSFESIIEAKQAWWSSDANTLYITLSDRYSKNHIVYKVNPENGKARILFKESYPTYLNTSSLLKFSVGIPKGSSLPNGDILWLSERSGYYHLYLYDGNTGELNRKLTQGKWNINTVIDIDTENMVIYLGVTGKNTAIDPYYQHYYALNINTGSMKLLTPENAHHSIISDMYYYGERLSPNRKYLIDTYSRVDLPPITVLRTIDGKLIKELARADISQMLSQGFTMPERFSAMAADGKTKLYGTILRPSNYDKDKKYPVIDSLYPGPQLNRAFPDFMTNLLFMFPQAQAELGFVVIALDGRGTPGRSKSFTDYSYNNLQSAGGLEDHIHVFSQLEKIYPEMDFTRLGAYGSSGGGYAAARAMLSYPNYYKVGVAAAGNHDQRLYIPIWGDTYMGPNDGENFKKAANATYAHRLEGKLLLIHGGLDTNVPPINSINLHQAFIDAGKDVEFLYVPKGDHGVVFSGHALDKSWEFLVQNLK